MKSKLIDNSSMIHKVIFLRFSFFFYRRDTTIIRVEKKELG